MVEEGGTPRTVATCKELYLTNCAHASLDNMADLERSLYYYDYQDKTSYPPPNSQPHPPKKTAVGETAKPQEGSLEGKVQPEGRWKTKKSPSVELFA